MPRANSIRDAILEAAERRLIDSGPAALRLQDVAADAGTKHPNVLHHFGSRDGLIRAVITRSLDEMNRQVLEALSRSSGAPDQLTALLDGLFELMDTRGYGRLVGWLSLSGYQLAAEGVPLTAVADAVHGLRKTRGGKQDSIHAVILTAMTVTAATYQLPALLAQLGQSDAARFRTWFSRLLLQHLELE